MKSHYLVEKFKAAKPFIAVLIMQFGLAGMDILCKAALNEGVSNYVLIVYRHAVATLVVAPFAVVFDKKLRPKMTLSIFTKIMVLGLLEPVINQNLYYLGMKYTTATFGAAMSNILPALTFVMAWILRLEKVKLTSIRSQSKLLVTAATVAGALIMTVVKGPILKLFWTRSTTTTSIQHQTNSIDIHSSIKGGLMISAGCFCCACFVILQVFDLSMTLRTYPAELSLSAWICLMGTLEGTAVALVMERGNAAVWAIHWDGKLLAVVYSGIVCSALGYYIQGVVMKHRGPVFLTAFSPLSMVIVAVMSSFILREQLSLGRLFGALVIMIGLYLVVWGKSKEVSPEGELETTRIVGEEKERSNLEVVTITSSSNLEN